MVKYGYCEIRRFDPQCCLYYALIVEVIFKYRTTNSGNITAKNQILFL